MLYAPEDPARLPTMRVVAAYVPVVSVNVTFVPESLPIIKLVTDIELAVNVKVPPSIISVLVPAPCAIGLVTLKSPPSK